MSSFATFSRILSKIPAPSESVASWPLVGPQLHSMWSQAHADLPALVKSLQPQLGDIAKSVLGFVGGIGVGLLQFLAAFIIAGIIMAFGEEGGDELCHHLRTGAVGRALLRGWSADEHGAAAATYQDLLVSAKQMQQRALPQIQQQARTLDAGKVLEMERKPMLEEAQSR